MPWPWVPVAAVLGGTSQYHARRCETVTIAACARASIIMPSSPFHLVIGHHKYWSAEDVPFATSGARKPIHTKYFVQTTIWTSSLWRVQKYVMSSAANGVQTHVTQASKARSKDTTGARNMTYTSARHNASSRTCTASAVNTIIAFPPPKTAQSTVEARGLLAFAQSSLQNGPYACDLETSAFQLLP